MGVVQSTIDALTETRSRLRLMMAEKLTIYERAKAHVFEYLLEGKYELARIEAEDWVQKSSSFNAYELLEKICEKLSQELPEMVSKRELTRAQTDHAGSVCWAASHYRLQLPELQRVADILKEMYEGCRNGSYGVNTELVYFANAAHEPSLGMIMQRLLDMTDNMGEEEREICRSGIEDCMSTYASGAAIELPQSSRPATARRSTSAVMPPPYEHPPTFNKIYPPI